MSVDGLAHSGRDAGTGRRGSFASVAGVAVLVAVVAAGAASFAPRLSDPAAGNPRWLLDVMSAVVALTLTAGSVALVYTVWPRRGRRDGGDDVEDHVGSRRAKLSALTMVVLVFAVWLLFANRSEDERQPMPPAGTMPSPDEATDDPDRTRVDWWVAPGAVGVAAVVTAAGAVAARRQRQRIAQRRRDDERVVPDVSEMLDRSIDALEAEPDPRRAVIAAYARMESWLAASGIARAPWETPFEYLDRVLVDLGATAGIAETLTDLFETAEFSAHPITPEMKRVALDSLLQLRDELDLVA